MVYFNSDCLGHYNFSHIADCARKRFLEGVDTISLMQQANSEQEREEVALVCMLDIDDDVIRDIKLSCRYASECKVTNCRSVLRKLIEETRKAI